MRLSEFDYHLPQHLIAQHPLKDRSASRLLVVDRQTSELSHHHFYDITQYLEPGDCLVVNDTKVLPARLIGVKEETNASIELLLLHEISGNNWECLAKPVRRLHVGTIITFGSLLTATVTAIKDQGIVEVTFTYEGIFYEVLDQLGEMPLPPYIKERLDDPDRYQTVYANAMGSAAAPTAGLHFTPELLAEIQAKGIPVVQITLHVGLGTFRPVSVDDVSDHQMHEEYYEVSESAASQIKQAKRVIAVGTTVVRTLETMMKRHGQVQATSGWSDLFITPGFKYEIVDQLITNFHLPKSTLLMLVSAFSSKELMMKAYHEAIENEYRFFSFGDAMLIR
jgi:S-adenosylmethionine:tRNA ribosyltransferase-isomerase